MRFAKRETGADGGEVSSGSSWKPCDNDALVADREPLTADREPLTADRAPLTANR